MWSVRNIFVSLAPESWLPVISTAHHRYHCHHCYQRWLSGDTWAHVWLKSDNKCFLSHISRLSLSSRLGLSFLEWNLINVLIFVMIVIDIHFIKFMTFWSIAWSPVCDRSTFRLIAWPSLPSMASNCGLRGSYCAKRSRTRQTISTAYRSLTIFG